jgi:hypothetical protein
MSIKRNHSSLERIVRRRGVPQPPSVDVLVAEVRSCLVAASPAPVKPDTDGVLGGIVVMWEFTLAYEDVQEFHNFLRENERYITDALKKSTKAIYRGTYMQYGPGEPRYRTVWAYESLDAMSTAWSSNLKTKSANLYNAVRRLRAYWLRDPDRSEQRWVPGRFYFDPGEDHGDGFAKLTLDATTLDAPKAGKSGGGGRRR